MGLVDSVSLNYMMFKVIFPNATGSITSAHEKQSLNAPNAELAGVKETLELHHLYLTILFLQPTVGMNQ